MDIQEETMIQMNIQNIQNGHPEFSRDRVAAEFHGAYVLVEGVYVRLLPQVVQLHPRVLPRRDQLRTTRFVSGNGGIGDTFLWFMSMSSKTVSHACRPCMHEMDPFDGQFDDASASASEGCLGSLTCSRLWSGWNRSACTTPRWALKLCVQYFRACGKHKAEQERVSRARKI
eukprot:COSAG04_NODE_1898_length_5276_cov_3.166506_6_plen_172_part_00